jgi:hypothetical protein
LLLSGDYAYVASGYDGLAMIDVSNPSNPKNVDLPYIHTYGRSVAISGQYAFLGTGIDFESPRPELSVIGSMSAFSAR